LSLRLGSMSFSSLLAFSSLLSANAVVPFSPALRLFGDAIKNGPIAAHTETQVFNHTCGAAPCMITQLHVPSIYPQGGCPWDWEEGVLRFYVDGEASPSIVVTLLQLASVGAGGAQGNSHKDVSPFSSGLFGKNAQTGGVWSTMRIPFQTSIAISLQPPDSCDKTQIFWMIIRGVEAGGITLGDVALPPAAKLVQSKIVGTTYAPDNFITLAAADKSLDGMLLSTFIDATSADPNYLEGCFHIVNGDNTTQFLSSGTEDYFLSASYFDEGVFAGSEAGLTWRGAGGDLSAYKTHQRDVLPFHGGMQFVWRNNEDGRSCPNRWPQASRPSTSPTGLRTGPMNLTSIVYFYAWPAA